MHIAHQRLLRLVWYIDIDNDHDFFTVVVFQPGMCGAAFYSAGRGEGENPRGGAGRGEKARKSTNSKFLQKCEKYNITYYNINYNIIIIL